MIALICACRLEAGFAELEGRDMRGLKEATTDAIVAHVCPIGEEVGRLLRDKVHLHAVLSGGSPAYSGKFAPPTPQLTYFGSIFVSSHF